MSGKHLPHVPRMAGYQRDWTSGRNASSLPGRDRLQRIHDPQAFLPSQGNAGFR